MHLKALREVTRRVRSHANKNLARASKADKDSELQFLGVTVPTIRRETKLGFTFQTGDVRQDLQYWNEVWRLSPVFEVMCVSLAALDLRRKSLSLFDWAALESWVSRAENWAHADWLASLISHVASNHPSDVLPSLRLWSGSDCTWRARVGLVAHIHYTGKNAVYLPLSTVLNAVEASVANRHLPVHRARCWVLREMYRMYPSEVSMYVQGRPSQYTAGERRRIIT